MVVSTVRQRVLTMKKRQSRAAHRQVWRSRGCISRRVSRCLRARFRSVEETLSRRRSNVMADLRTAVFSSAAYIGRASADGCGLPLFRAGNCGAGRLSVRTAIGSRANGAAKTTEEIRNARACFGEFKRSWDYCGAAMRRTVWSRAHVALPDGGLLSY